MAFNSILGHQEVFKNQECVVQLQHSMVVFDLDGQGAILSTLFWTNKRVRSGFLPAEEHCVEGFQRDTEGLPLHDCEDVRLEGQRRMRPCSTSSASPTSQRLKSVVVKSKSRLQAT